MNSVISSVSPGLSRASSWRVRRRIRSLACRPARRPYSTQESWEYAEELASECGIKKLKDDDDDDEEEGRLIDPLRSARRPG
jgi:hypothetical protein